MAHLKCLKTYYLPCILDKVKESHFNSTSDEVIWPKKFQIPCMDQNVPFWQFFRQGRDGRALLVRPSRIPHRISKILFALGADEFLAMLKGKIREAPYFFYGSIC